ncbi:dihydroneopterin aldolase [Rhodobacteraceae bacterium NNCM2]|nr:dihydroneopterin aldolase [Coraliihabitans acroporae]
MKKSATSARTGQEQPLHADMPDRIFLSNYVRDIEVGAYREEHGVTQRVRFDITLEVTRNTAHIDDRVGRVINYDDLVQAIEDLAEGERINLLETFAERLASAILIDPRARRAVIRIEKLDRLVNGATLGVEIVRSRTPETNEKVWALAPDQK